MATATYKRGEMRTVTYLATADVAANEIVVCGVVDAKKCHVGVARVAIADTETGVVAVSGVFEFPKVSAAVIKAGEAVNWDSSAGGVEDNAHTTGAGDVAEFGIAMADAGNGTTVVDIDIAEPGSYDAA